MSFLWVSPDAYRVSQMAAESTFPHGQLFLLHCPFMQFKIYIPVLSLFFPLLHLIFLKCHMSLSLGDTGATQPLALWSWLSLWELSNSLTHHETLTDFKMIWLVCVWYLLSDLWTEELALKFILYAVIHRYCSVETEAWTVLLSTWNNEAQACQNLAKQSLPVLVLELSLTSQEQLSFYLGFSLGS